MDKKSDKSSQVEEQLDESQFNSAAAARRKLIRTLGAAGGTVLTGSLLSAWQKPIVESVLIPAHGQTSGVTTPAPTATQPPACSNEFGWTISMGPAVVGASTYEQEADMSLFLNGSLVTSTSVFTGSPATSLAFSSTTDIGSTATLGYAVAWRALLPSLTFPFSFSATCCSDDLLFATNIGGPVTSGAVSLPNFRPVAYTSDGQCQFAT